MSARMLAGPLGAALGMPPRDVFELFGVGRSTASRYLTRGIPAVTAQHLAELAGLDHRVVWPDWDEVIAEDVADRVRRRTAPETRQRSKSINDLPELLRNIRFRADEAVAR